MIFRKADYDDIERLAEIRKIQLQDEGQKPDVDMDDNLRGFFDEKMRSGDLIEWVAEDDHGGIIATAAILFMDFPPAFTNPIGRRGYITNMYTADEYRGRGIAGKLMQKLEEEAKDQGISMLVLHASVMGRKAYVKSGFKETEVVMEKTIEI